MGSTVASSVRVCVGLCGSAYAGHRFRDAKATKPPFEALKLEAECE